VHAGIRPDKPLEEQEIEDMLFIRENFYNHKHILKQLVIFGHTSFKSPFIEEDKIGIDTGCGKYENTKLTAYICNENKFVQS
jgi:serine/threonine protein phosphatase 1